MVESGYLCVLAVIPEVLLKGKQTASSKFRIFGYYKRQKFKNYDFFDIVWQNLKQAVIFKHTPTIDQQ